MKKKKVYYYEKEKRYTSLSEYTRIVLVEYVWVPYISLSSMPHF
jgi:hypothetical protein